MKDISPIHRLFSLTLTLVALLFGVGGALADDLAEARSLFNTANYTDNEEANDKAVAIFERLNTERPGDPVVLAYLGATRAVAGRYAMMPWTKMRHVDAGLAYLDKALALPDGAEPAAGGVPATDEVRLVAASTYLALPAMFNTADKGRQLAQGLVDRLDGAQWPESFRTAVYIVAARAAESDGKTEDARRWLEKARDRVDAFNRLSFNALEAELK